MSLAALLLALAPANPIGGFETGAGAPSSTTGGEAEPLAGKVVVLDPGHQLGNQHHPRRTSRPVPAGGFEKPCNTAGGDGLGFRSDLGTLNLSDVPTVMVELGNMRNARDAHRMTTPQGRQRYADALLGAVRRFLG
ncbi:hypothetical protein [Nocardioides pyridinolyticus]